MAAYAAETSTPIAWMPTSFALPEKRPPAWSGVSAFVANTPVMMAPAMPPTPWTPNASSESS